MSSMPASVRITASVGRGCANQRNDVMVIQHLINNRLATGMRALKVDGHCGVLTISAIEEIQRRNLRMNPPDGKIDHNGATLRFLVSGVAGNGAHAHTAAHHKPAGTGGTFPADIIADGHLIAAARPYAHARTLIGDPDKFAD